MRIGASFEEEITLHKVQIDGRGGDSAIDIFFRSADDAIIASAIDGGNRTPTPVQALAFSDGTILLKAPSVVVNQSPSEEEVEELRKKLKSETPAHELLFR